MISKLKQIWHIDRVRQVLIACVIALGVSQVLLSPLDNIVWHIQARLSEQKASGDIVFIGANENLADPDNPGGRFRLARALQNLGTAGVNRVFVDVQFDKPSEAAADQALHDAILKLGSRIILVRKVVTNVDGKNDLEGTLPKIAGKAATVPNDRFVDFMGFTWSMPMMIQTDKGLKETLPVSLANFRSPANQDINIVYSFAPSSIPHSDLSKVANVKDDAAAPGNLSRFAGKNVVIGLASQFSNRSDVVANIPGQIDLPASYVSIYAAETLKAGLGHSPSSLQVFLAFAAILLLLAARARGPRPRHAGYFAIGAAIPALVWILAQYGIRANLSTSIALLGSYAALRLRERWQSRFALTDEATKLPTFRALEQQLDKDLDPAALVVAKIHRLDEVLSTLPDELHADYILRVADRLKVTDSKLQIYIGGGRYLAWLSAEPDMQELSQHLRGVRALFAQPLIVGDTAVDAGITFGIDRTLSAKGRQRVAMALTAAEQSSEAHRPVSIAEETSESERLWNISLQARIDSALNKGEIFVVYQPQISLHNGVMIGAEALVRWDDPTRGPIPPSQFIEQCEMAGRMEHLTRHVLEQAIRGFISLGECAPEPSLSVNISATLLHDTNLLGMIEEVLAETGFDPRRLILEITETSKIIDPALARRIIEQLKLQGMRISLDDFGVGAASLETFLEFPFDELKIDRSFVDAVRHNRKARAIVKNLLAIGREARIAVVAEGIESDQVLNILSGFGLDIAQGYAISYPLPIHSLKQFQILNQSGRKANMV